MAQISFHSAATFPSPRSRNLRKPLPSLICLSVQLTLTDAPPGHSTPSRTRRLIDVEAHQEVFTWVLRRVAVYSNRRRIRGRRGKALLGRRGERLERPFAHLYETGGLRRTHLRGRNNILKRVLIHVSALNLGFLMRAAMGVVTPRSLQDRTRSIVSARIRSWASAFGALSITIAFPRLLSRLTFGLMRLTIALGIEAQKLTLTTGC